jgi:hypothetical protein
MIVGAGLLLLGSLLIELIVFLNIGPEGRESFEEFDNSNSMFGFALLAIGLIVYFIQRRFFSVKKEDQKKDHDVRLEIGFSHIVSTLGEGAFLSLTMYNTGTLPATIKSAQIHMTDERVMFVAMNDLTDEVFGNVKIDPGDNYALQIASRRFKEEDIRHDQISKAYVINGLGDWIANHNDPSETLIANKNSFASETPEAE